MDGPLKIVIVGCGAAGIAFAIELRKKLKPGTYEFTIYDKGEGPGGTWRDNTYPGCACDVESHFYSLSTHLNPNWTTRFASQPEILAYWADIFEKEGLKPNTVFKTTHVSSTWDASTNTYTSTFSPNSTPSETFTITSHVLISSVGGFSIPTIPHALKEKGLDNFEGKYWHSARWNPGNVNLEGQRVGVIGNGCSAAQLIPKVAEVKGSEVWNFIRGRNWYMYRDNSTYSGLIKWIFKWVPGVMWMHRNYYFIRNELRWSFASSQDNIVNLTYQKTLANHIKQLAPEKYVDKLIPDFPVGCKRIVIDNDYLKSLNREDVHLVTDGIEKFEDKGIRLTTGDLIPLDVIILATGYDVSASGFGINVTGKDGIKLNDQWKEQGGPQAFVGTTVHNFPNYYMIVGPNTITGHTSVIAFIEVQVGYILKFMEQMVKNKAKSFEIKEEPEREFNVWLKNKSAISAQGGNCRAWYTVGQKNTSTWPGTVTSFWWSIRKIDKSVYDIKY